MNKLLRQSVKIGIILMIAVMGYYGGWWDGLFTQTSRLNTISPQTIAPDLSIFKTKLSGWNNRHKAWEVEAERIIQSAGGNSVYFENISQGIIFSVKGKKVFFNAAWARWEKLRGELIIGGGLEARVEDKVLVTEELAMQYKTETLVCSHEITVKGDEVTMRAGRMNLDLKNEMLVLDGGIEFVQKGDSIRAKGINYDLKNDQFDLVEPEGVTLNL